MPCGDDFDSIRRAVALDVAMGRHETYIPVGGADLGRIGAFAVECARENRVDATWRLVMTAMGACVAVLYDRR